MSENEIACEIAGILGYRLAVIDMEHGVLDIRGTSRLIATARQNGLESLTRVDAPSRVSIQHALDLGSDGVIIPRILGVAHAREASAFAKYPPLGTRGYGGGRTVHFQPAPQNFVETENRRVKCYAMIETAEALADVERIAELPTVDGLFVGPNDLSLARGRGEYRADGSDHKDIERIAEAARCAGKPWGAPIHSEIDRDFTRTLGAGFQVITDDLTGLRDGLRLALKWARNNGGSAELENFQ
jgi:2-keto-3-deoxy-L-rhamnonate aldolase RhmA